MQVEIGQHHHWLRTAMLVAIVAYLGWWGWHQWNRPVVHAGDITQMSAAVRWQTALAEGNYDVAYAYLHPAQQAALSQEAFKACAFQLQPGRQVDPRHTSYSITATSHVRADVAGTSLVKQDATAVTVESGAAGAQRTTMTWPMVDVGGPPWSQTNPGPWRVVFPSSLWDICTRGR